MSINARRHAFGGFAPNLRLQVPKVYEKVGLPSQLVCDHWRMRGDAGYDGDTYALALHRLDQTAEVAVARDKHHLVDMLRELHGVDGKLDVHVALHLSTPRGIDEFLAGLGDDRKSVVIEPVDQRADGRIFPILEHRRVVEGAQQGPTALDFLKQAPVIDVEPERLRGRVKIGAIDKNSDPVAVRTRHNGPLRKREPVSGAPQWGRCPKQF